MGAILDGPDVVLDELESEPDNFGTGPNPFAELNGRMIEYGLTVCGDG